jgi:transposase
MAKKPRLHVLQCDFFSGLLAPPPPTQQPSLAPIGDFLSLATTSVERGGCNKSPPINQKESAALRGVRAMTKKASFKPYQQNQMSLLPIDLETLIPENHMVRVVDRAIESMNTKPLFDLYPGGGASAYNPVMMLKVIVYAYADKIYSSRIIAKATRENINFLWLTGNVQLDFMTINRFRGERLKGIIDGIFTEVIDLLLREGYIKFEQYFMDGTKIEANAGKYSWVWGKSTKRYKENLRKKVAGHLAEIQQVAKRRNPRTELAACGTQR